MIPPRTTQQAGFTLTELAIVLIIVALLIGSMLPPLSAQQDIRHEAETQKLLSETKEALLGFAAAKCRLPCPANPATPSGTANAGIEYASNSTGCNTSMEGVVPWATLGVPEIDAWGRRLTYRVKEEFAKTVTGCGSGTAAFSLGSDGDITVRVTSGGTIVASEIPVIVGSNGKNGFRGYLPNGNRLSASSDTDEEKNADADSTFISKTATSTFDDIVDWISPHILKSRMIAAGRLP